MLLVRFQKTFRERAPEWTLATILWGWGFTLLLPGDSFNRPFFKPLAAIASEMQWGLATSLIGSARIAALYVNGSRKSTPRIRQVGSVFGMLIWACLLQGALQVEWHSPAVFTYAGLFVLEAIMFSYAGEDAIKNRVAAYHGRN